MPNETKAETHVPLPSMIPNVAPSTEGAMGVGGLLAATVWAIFHYRRKASRDNTEIVKDRVEGDLIANMMRDREAVIKERDAAAASERIAWTEHNKVTVENAGLKATVEYQQREIARLTQAMTELQKQFDEIKDRLQKLARGATGHTGLGDLPEP